MNKHKKKFGLTAPQKSQVRPKQSQDAQKIRHNQYGKKHRSYIEQRPFLHCHFSLFRFYRAIFGVGAGKNFFSLYVYRLTTIVF